MVTDQLYANVVEVDITPPVGTGLDGYVARKGNSLGIHDPLLGQVLLLDLGEQQLVLISLDLLGITLEWTQQIREGIAQAIGVPTDHTLVACSHTHSGAAGFMPPSPGITSFEDPKLKKSVARKLIGAAIRAKQGLLPAQIGVGRGNVRGIGLNRNDPLNGPVDDEVIVMNVIDIDGNPIAVWVNHGCHPTVLGPENLYYSADYPGAMRSNLRKIYPNTVFLFTNGASGDVSTRFTRRDQSYNEVERMGRLLAGEVLKVMQTNNPQQGVKLSAITKEIELKFRSFPDKHTTQLEIERFKAKLEKLIASGASHGEIRRAITRVQGAEGQAEMANGIRGRSSNTSQIQILTIGDLTLVGLPGETFTSTVLDIKSSSSKSNICVVSYANDYQGYFPDAFSINTGSYETLISPYNVDVAKMLSETVIGLIQNG